MDAIQNVVRNVRITDSLAEEVQKKFLNFLENFKDADGLKYAHAAKRMLDIEKTSLPISLNDLTVFNEVLAQHVVLLFYRLFPYLCKATQKFVNDHLPDTEDSKREYQCHFIDFPTLTSLRDLKTKSLGQLVKFRAQVIRSHAVHPELITGVFKCADCGTVIKNVEQEFIYTQPTVCANPQCPNRKSFDLDNDESKYVDFQKVRVQETQGELPRGSVPRSMDVIMRGGIVEMTQPGDHSEFIGTLIVIPDISQMAVPGSKTVETKPLRQTEGYASGVTGLKSLGVRELTYRIAFLASSVSTVNNKYMDTDDLQGDEELTFESFSKKMTNEELDRLYSMSKDHNLVSNLCHSLFPTIHGCDEVKRGILLMLFGGVPKVTEEGTKLRGDINVCIVGDPSTAKSQFLKRVEQFAHRAVYTSGKASSAAGLTAAVVKDQESYEYVIEAGALMLANNGICCIDEFDKMDVKDQVAIHEAMEQQTISITKAGIKATLNARTSVLAAANPVNGRYDRSKSLKQNISLTGPIMSRFDLFFVLVDECSEVVDREIATTIINFHMTKSNNQVIPKVYTDEEIRRFITFARCFEPFLSMEAMEITIREYKKMRERDNSSGTQSAWKVTVRQLESLIRLSEAFARMRFSETVTAADARNAVSLLNKSVIRVEQADINLGDEVFGDVTAAADGAVLFDVDMEGNNNESNVVDNEGGNVGAAVPSKMSYEEYYRISGALITHMKEQESCDSYDTQPIRKNDLVNWYLESVIDTIQDEFTLCHKKFEVEKIIDRLINKDNMLMEIRDQLTDGDVDATNPMITLHPCVILE